MRQSTKDKINELIGEDFESIPSGTIYNGKLELWDEYGMTEEAKFLIRHGVITLAGNRYIYL